MHQTGHHRGTLHELRPEALNYCWDNAIEPAVEVDPGSEVGFHVRDASDRQITAHSDAADVVKLDFSRVNPISGPVFVKGARPGDVLQVELLEFRSADWGWTALIPGFGLLADEFPEPWLHISRVDDEHDRVVWSDRVTLPYRPFPGTIGVAPAEPGEHSIVPPSRWGGNLDIKHLRSGTTLFLPVGVEGALFSVGDTHAAQGDGEVCGTAVEAAMELVVRLSLRRDFAVEAPQYQLPAGALAAADQGAHHVCTGVASDLLDATKQAVRASIAYLGDHHGFARDEAYALASVAGDLRIHEVVDAPNWVVGLCLPVDLFAERS